MLKRVARGWVASKVAASVVAGSMAAASMTAACSGNGSSEQVVRRNLPAAAPASEPVQVSTRAAASEPAEAREGLTSQEVEKALNRLEAELR